MNRNRTIISGLVMIVLLGGMISLWAQGSELKDMLKVDPQNTEILLKLGKQCHDLGGNGDKKAAKKSVQYLRRLLDLEPGNSVAMVYYGSALTMRARDVFFPWDKMKYMKKGLVQMDKAAALTPDHREVRLIRGINSSQLPEAFNRISTAREDFKVIEKLLQDTSVPASETFCLSYQYYYGCVLLKDQKPEGARERFEMIIQINPESEYGRMAQRKLEEMEAL